jgi:hypothetical protein
MGGKPYFGLALECWLSSRLRSFPRRPLYARFPPEGEVAVSKNVGSLTTEAV